ncbi:hypothetical protein ACNOYE_36835 [Nannocystaceae bacterium ST9]
MAIKSPTPMPHVDDHLVEAEITRDEMIRGERVHAAPAKEPHAERHTRLDYVTLAHVAEDYVVATDLLTRWNPGSDFATDTSIRKAGLDPATGRRYLEELAFEIVSEQSKRDITMRAEDLTERGVRRLIAIFVKQGKVCEWSRELGGWVELPREFMLDDPTLVRPLPIRALLDAAAADDAVVDALARKRNPKLVELVEGGVELGIERGIARGIERGRKQGLERALALACELVDVRFGPNQRAQLEPLDAAALEALIARVRDERRWPL